jgi:hypothetical protein
MYLRQVGSGLSYFDEIWTRVIQNNAIVGDCGGDAVDELNPDLPLIGRSLIKSHQESPRLPSIRNARLRRLRHRCMRAGGDTKVSNTEGGQIWEIGKLPSFVYYSRCSFV